VPRIKGFVFGCMVTKGEVRRDAGVRVIRDGVVVAEDTMTSLRRFKDDVKEVREGFECGIGLDKFQDVKEGDVWRPTRPSRSPATDPDRTTPVSDERTQGRVHYGVARVDLYLPGSDSLKAKRMSLRRARAALMEQLGASVAEVGAQDRWQRAVLGVAVAASTATGVDRVLERITAVLERDPRIEVLGITDLVDHLDADAGEQLLPGHPGT
jgi:uncharacterized protein